MKKNKKYGLVLVTITVIIFLSACSKKTDDKFIVESNFNNSSLIQLYVATVNVTRNHFYIDGKQLSGSTLSSGSIFPSAAYASSVTSGIKAFLIRDTLTATTQLPLSFSQSFQPGKNYTVFMYDTITSPKQKTVETNIVIPADTSVRIRFANFIYNPSDVPAIDIFSFNKNANIFTNVAVTDVTSFIPYPSRLATDTLYIRETGSTTNIIKLSLTGGLTDKRSYTLIYRGSHRGTRVASLIANR